MDRVTGMGETTISQARAFRPFALFAALYLRGLSFEDELKEEFIRSSPNAFTQLPPPAAIASVPRFFHEARHSASRELRAYINESWSRHQGKYYFTRRGGHQPQEVAIDPAVAAKCENSPEVVFEGAVGEFLRVFKALDVFDDRLD